MHVEATPLLRTKLDLPPPRAHTLSRDRLLNEVWGHGYYGTTRTLDQVIVQLRKKLGDSADHPKHLLTVHGVGYKLMLDDCKPGTRAEG